MTVGWSSEVPPRRGGALFPNFGDRFGVTNITHENDRERSGQTVATIPYRDVQPLSCMRVHPRSGLLPLSGRFNSRYPLQTEDSPCGDLLF